MHSTLQPKGSRLAPQQAAARLRRRGRSACTPAAQAVESAQAEAAFFKPTNGGGGGARALGVEVDVPRLGYVGEGVPSPFCTFQACPLPSPNSGPRTTVDKHNAFVSDEDRVLLKSISYGDSSSAGAEDCNADCNFDPRWCVRAGPRASLFFRPSDVRAAVVTCGGLCPGLNDVIRQLVLTLESGYGVSDIVGVQYGFRGFFEEGLPMLKLTKKTVNNIHLEGGSVLGTSRCVRCPPAPAAPARPAAHAPQRRRRRSQDRGLHHQARHQPAVRAGRQRHARGRRRHLRRVRAPQVRLRRGGRAQDDRQRHPAHRQDVRLRHGGGGGAARAARSLHRGQVRLPRCGRGEAGAPSAPGRSPLTRRRRWAASRASSLCMPASPAARWT